MKNNQYKIITYSSYENIPYPILEPAMAELNGNALKLFIYLCTLNVGEEIPFSPKYFCNLTHTSESGEKTAFYELVDKKYLQLRENNLYEFYPQKMINKNSN